MSTQTITDEQALALCQTLTDAGADWQTVAASSPIVASIETGTATVRDLVHLTSDVTLKSGPVVESTLYRNEITGQWHRTGWSDASQAQVYRPHTTDMFTEREDY